MKSILIVDDQEEYLYILDEMLVPIGYKIFKSENGEKALEVVQNEKIDLILSDVNMPVMDGLDLCKKIKNNEKTRNIPIVLLSAVKKDLDDMVSGIDQGADDYMAKPVERSLLIARVRSMIRMKELNDQLVEKKQLDSIAQVAVTVNHEINNPLQIITGAIGLLKNNRCETEEERLKQYDKINSNVFRIGDIVKQLSEITEPVKKKYKTGNIEMIDLEKSKYL